MGNQLLSVNNINSVNIYYQRFITISLVIAYVMIHTQLTGVYEDATLEQFYEGIARLPFGQRLLVPMLARGLGHFFSLSADPLFFIWELVFVALSVWALEKLLRLYFNQREAICLTWVFLIILPLIYVVNYRIVSDGIAAIFYPNDTATLFFMIIGLYLCLQKFWPWLILVVVLATLNRESGLLLVLLIPCLHWQKPFKHWMFPFIWAFIAFALTKMFVVWMVSDLSGTYIEWYYRSSYFTNFFANFYYLMQEYYVFYFCFSFACLPIFTFAFFDYIPYQLRPIRWLCLAFFLGLMMVGHVLETRIYGEIVSLLYLPTVIAIHSWLRDMQPLPYKQIRYTTLVDRYGIITILGLLLVFHFPINFIVEKLAHHFS